MLEEHRCKWIDGVEEECDVWELLYALTFSQSVQILILLSPETGDAL